MDTAVLQQETEPSKYVSTALIEELQQGLQTASDIDQNLLNLDLEARKGFSIDIKEGKLLADEMASSLKSLKKTASRIQPLLHH